MAPLLPPRGLLGVEHLLAERFLALDGLAGLRLQGVDLALEASCFPGRLQRGVVEPLRRLGGRGAGGELGGGEAELGLQGVHGAVPADPSHSGEVQCLPSRAGDRPRRQASVEEPRERLRSRVRRGGLALLHQPRLPLSACGSEQLLGLLGIELLQGLLALQEVSTQLLPVLLAHGGVADRACAPLLLELPPRFPERAREQVVAHRQRAPLEGRQSLACADLGEGLLRLCAELLR
mmetsp:Transcript_96439/g.241819  ORF Transcript_96439/g.241819 Transcript_96439/m.241819 type:complete len:235 (-) Transcript_96439:962-1666(-)